jgi:very-short-patch-repair endonuclease
MPFMYNDQLQKERIRELRKNQTEEENILWQEIRGRKINNLKFHRQYSIGPYIVDFFCPEIRLVIELDGERHKDAREYDAERENFLKNEDIKVLRFWNHEVMNDLKRVLERIREEIKNNPLNPSYNKGEIGGNPLVPFKCSLILL